jgi:hypothetical protein
MYPLLLYRPCRDFPRTIRSARFSALKIVDPLSGFPHQRLPAERAMPRRGFFLVFAHIDSPMNDSEIPPGWGFAPRKGHSLAWKGQLPASAFSAIRAGM